MVDPQTLDALLDLPADDRFTVAEALWNSVLSELEKQPLPDWHRRILEQRLAADDTDTEPSESWDNVRQRIEG